MGIRLIKTFLLTVMFCGACSSVLLSALQITTTRTYAAGGSGGGGSGTIGVQALATGKIYPSVIAGTTTQTVFQNGPQIEFWDERNDPLGFTLSAVSSNWLNASGEVIISFINHGMRTSVGNQITPVGSSSVAGLTVVQTSITGFVGAGTGSDSLDLVTGDATARIDRWRILPRMALQYPGGTLPGTFSATVTYTII